MNCPRCGTTMELEFELNFDEGEPIKAYRCPNCGEEITQ